MWYNKYMKEIKINKDYSIIVDDEDYKNVICYKWLVNKTHRNVYAYHYVKKGELFNCKMIEKYQIQRRSVKSGIKNEYKYTRYVIPLHWYILNYKDKLVIDHINGNGLDNRRKNLRIVTQTENLQNRRLNKNSKTAIKSVYRETDKNGYTVDVTRNKKRYRKRGFKTTEEATSYLKEIMKKV